MTRRDALTAEILRLQIRISKDKAAGKRTGALESHLCRLVAMRMQINRRKSA